jgi:hypothetical protein
MRQHKIMKLLLIMSFHILIYPCFSQKFKWENYSFQLANTKHEMVDINGKQVLKLERDLTILPFDDKNIESSVDLPTFAKLTNTNIRNGKIEVKVMSRIMENSPFPQARGFIGVAFRIDNENNFECIYLRPANGRAEDQLRRNHTVQYFAYPGYNFSRLRKEANGIYETYADIGLEEWIDVKIEFMKGKAKLYVNNQQHPSFIVNEMLGRTTSGSIGLWVEVGTIGFFKDLKITAWD